MWFWGRDKIMKQNRGSRNRPSCILSSNIWKRWSLQCSGEMMSFTIDVHLQMMPIQYRYWASNEQSKSWSLPHSIYLKLNSRLMVHLNVKYKTILHLEGSIGEYSWPWGRQRSFIRIQKVLIIKEKINKLYFFKMKIYSKDIIKDRRKRQVTEWHIWQRTYFQSI